MKIGVKTKKRLWLVAEWIIAVPAGIGLGLLWG